MNNLAVRYILKETLISVLINMALSCAFFYLQFHSFAVVPWTGRTGLVRDSVPQTFAVSFMSVLVPTLLTRGRGLRAGLPLLVELRRFRPSNVIIRAILIALVAAACGLALLYVVFGQESSGLNFRSALAFKCGYGALIALVVTPIAVWMALHDAAMGRAEKPVGQ